MKENTKGSIKNKVLVHCQVGMSRSATIVIGYLMRKFPDMTLNKAFRFVKSKRPIVNPNEGFIKQLKSFERTLENQRYKDLLDKKVIYEVKEEKKELKYNFPPKLSNQVQRNYHYTPKSSYTNHPKLEPKYYRSEERNTGPYAYYNNHGNALGGWKKKGEVKPRFVKTHNYQTNKHAGVNFLNQHLNRHRSSVFQQNGYGMMSDNGSKFTNKLAYNTGLASPNLDRYSKFNKEFNGFKREDKPHQYYQSRKLIYPV